MNCVIRFSNVATFLLLSLFFIAGSLSSARLVESEWKEIKSDHFVLRYQGADLKFADAVLRHAEADYDEIARSLGYSRRDQFWLWDNRCQIDLYETREAYQSASGETAWSNGYAIPKTRTIVSYQGSQEFLDSVLPHELAHLILKDFVGNADRAVPLWLDEGLAMAQEKKKRDYFDQIVHEMITKKKWIPFKMLAQIRSVQSFSTDEAALFYAQAQSLVRFLLEANSSGRFVQLCRNLRDGHSFEEALRKNYHGQFQSLEELEAKWVEAH